MMGRRHAPAQNAQASRRCSTSSSTASGRQYAAPHAERAAGGRNAARARKSCSPACCTTSPTSAFIRGDHGYWGAQLVEPYVEPEVAWAISNHQALRFFADEAVGYEYPKQYIKLFGPDYVPEPYIQEDYQKARDHKWYMTSRLITLNDLYAFDPNVQRRAGGVHRHRRPQLQAAEGRPGLRRQPRCAHVAHHQLADEVTSSPQPARITRNRLGHFRDRRDCAQYRTCGLNIRFANEKFYLKVIRNPSGGSREPPFMRGGQGHDLR